jgi:hypothetical protein
MERGVQDKSSSSSSKRGRGQRRRVQVRAGGVFNNEQGRAAVLSDTRHGMGKGRKKKDAGAAWIAIAACRDPYRSEAGRA